MCFRTLLGARSGTGQRSAFVLEDGSTVELNSQSRIDVRFSKQQRRVELAQGQAWFSVAKNPNRPFIVVAGNRQIVALGTQFDVRLDERLLQVTLIEGKVRVEAAPADAVELTPGRQFVAELPATGYGPRVRDIDVAKVTAWREGRIFLDDVPLAEAVLTAR